ncbi:hypothetical protein OPW32_17385 [Vibrio europaeus]|uniref:hypothetical protein n=1 Tax=Vibrio europaeus TaxID=300876 RepID=UPI00234212C3|nr:hypothetical protein [Vibrio europaeus]MDC5850971.1 hypothetical protein [Vibrio europaeus]
MKTKTILAGALSALLLTACQSTSENTLTPTASKEIIEEARNALSAHDEITVDGEGFISLVQTLPNGMMWDRTVTKKVGREFSCDSLRYFVEKGMVVSVHFKGRRGRFEQYDENRCLEEDQYL